MANPKCRLLHILSSIYAILLLLTLGLRVGSRALERREKINAFRYESDLKMTDYQQGFPMEEIDFETFRYWYTYSMAAASGDGDPEPIGHGLSCQYTTDPLGISIAGTRFPFSIR